VLVLVISKQYSFIAIHTIDVSATAFGSHVLPGAEKRKGGEAEIDF
jgi:hypothetical protein